MKRKIRVGERYALSRRKLRYFASKLSSLLAVVSLMCLYAAKQASAQEAEPAAPAVADIKPLQIGDTIPEYLWNLPLQVVNHPDGKDTITLNDYRDKKLIILDFWATWCVPCIKSLAKLDTLQKQFSAGLAVIPVTYENDDQANSFFKGKGWLLPTAVSQTELKKYFPHKSIPHQIWIIHGVVSGVTGAEDITRENINGILRGSNFSLKTKSDMLDFHPTRNLAVFADRAASQIYASSTTTGHIAGIPSSIGRRVNGDLQYIYYTNVAITQMYQRTLGIEHNQLMVVSDKVGDYVYSGNKQHLYAYQLVLPKYVRQTEVTERILRDLNTCFKLQIDTQIVLKDCFVISRSEGSAGTNSMTRLPSCISDKSNTYKLSTFIELLNFYPSWSPNLPRYIDESGGGGQVHGGSYRDLQHDFHKLSEFLRPYGLTVTKEKRPLKMYVLSDKTLNGLASYHKP